jgi:hypothetical protein
MAKTNHSASTSPAWMKLFGAVALMVAFCVCVSATEITSLVSRHVSIRPQTILLRGLTANSQYSLLYSVTSLSELTAESRIQVEIHQGTTKLVQKTLHAGDPDYYTQFRVPIAGDASLIIKPSNVKGDSLFQVNQWPLSSQVKSLPVHRWQDAVPIHLGKTVFASGDDAEYIPIAGTSRRANAEDPSATDWYSFDFKESSPKLIFFQIDLMERDQVPVNVALYRVVDGDLQEYYEGEDPVTNPHEVQALPGNKFTPRILKDRGVYYIAVRASHPEYKLRTRVYDPPPYKDPRRAVRTGLDYILAAGDSWHANTPRRGGILDRISTVHQETSLCVACHATHFPLRAQLYATRNGYPVVERQQLQFLTERFYNNPRPFYGFQSAATWARMISAPANVLGRMSHLIDIFENQVTGERRDSFHKGIEGYLKLYYAGREKLPPDETNGNTPLVSAHEVAWYAWTVTHDPQLPDLIAGGEVKNMIDLCYQTLALADIDRGKYAAQVQKNADRILSLQRPDGQWSMQFDPKQAEVEFQTGHALWALHAAGIPADNPQVAKAIGYLLGRQQPFGGWMDPLQSFENFRTPFRETQFATVALSYYFPQQGRAKGWNATAPSKLSANPVELLEELDNIWDPVSADMRKQIEAAALSNDALIRQAATETLGRLGVASTVYDQLLGDPSKLVQRTAAWAVRQTYSRHPQTPSAFLATALTSHNDRVRWAATRVFSAHFAALASRPQFAAQLAKLIDDPVITTRINAIKGLWQFWFWSADTGARDLIEDKILAALEHQQPEWVQRNLDAAVYNLADENIRYLYNNWIPLLPGEEDRERAIHGRLAVESRLANKFAGILEHGPDVQKKALLRGLTRFPLRRGDVYDLNADLTKAAPPVYNRIGNDIEQIAFFGESRERFAQALLPALNSADVEMRRLAEEAALLVRDNRFTDVNRLAGVSGAATKQVMAKVEESPEAADIARALKPDPRSNPAGGVVPAKAHPPSAKLDEAYFRGYVEPILQKRGKDGYACVHCHATHTLFDGTWSTAKNVVDMDNPENSLILRKPTSSADTEGITNSTTLAHGGGVRFAKDSPEYKIILNWIKRCERLKVPRFAG